MLIVLSDDVVAACGDADDVVLFKDKRICRNCLADLQKAEL